MKIILLILLTSCTLLNAEYQRHKVRGPPHLSRIPPSKQFSKKWHQQSQHPPRGPIRSRPIPVHMPSSHKIPMGIPQTPPRAVSLPVRTFWKNAQPNIKIPQEKPYIQEKPFLAAPSISSQELDYHIQTNSIPTTHTNPIKQIGEKGPIHTIPAPNLSLRDKPIVVEDVKYQVKAPYKNLEQHNQYQVKAHYKNLEHNQYQVTEQPEGMTKSKVYRENHQFLQHQQALPQQLYQQQLQQQRQIQKQQQQIQKQQQRQQLQLQQQFLQQQQLQKQVEIQPQQLYYVNDPLGIPQTLNLQTQKDPQGNLHLNSQLGPEIYKLIGAAYPQQQVQEAEQTFYQPKKQVPNYQALLTQQLFQPEQQDFEQRGPSDDTGRVASEKTNFAPDFQSFNYDEQAHQKSLKGLSKEQLSSLVTAAYSLDSNAPVIESRNSVDPLAQAQLVQSYFDTRSGVDENDVEPDAKPSSGQKSEPDKIKEELLSSSYFSSLPSKEAADRLAHLQAAGKINSNLMKISADDQQNDSGKDEGLEEERVSDEGSNENYPENDQGEEYEEYSLEDGNTSSEERNREFGDRLVPNRKNN